MLAALTRSIEKNFNFPQDCFGGSFNGIRNIVTQYLFPVEQKFKANYKCARIAFIDIALMSDFVCLGFVN